MPLNMDITLVNTPKDKNYYYNASILKEQNNIFVLIRTDNLVPIPLKLSCSITTGVIKNYPQSTKLTVLDSIHLPPVKGRLCLNSKTQSLPLVEHSGIQDARIFLNNSSTYIICNTLNNSCGNNVYIGKMNEARDRFEFYKQVFTNFPLEHREKNWSPLRSIDSEHYLFSKEIEPHVLVSINLTNGNTNLVYSSSNPTLKKMFASKGRFFLRGSTNGVLLGDKILCLGHICGKGRQYQHFFYLLNNRPPFAIVQFSKFFCFPINNFCHNIQFAPSMIKWNDEKILISLSEQDKTLYIVDIYIEDILNYMIYK